ncbi:MAG: hypothetical protein IPJ86_18200 [Bacteroidetes bacterium]|nr:hypothetical protein [Bacteroidota bacterium]MBK9318046.1 hypothetical protein [Bacteroidota bacterium]
MNNHSTIPVKGKAKLTMNRYLIILTLALAGLLTASSCKKTEPCEAIITVVDTLGRPVSAAKVVLRQDSVVNPQTGVRADVFDEEFTTSNGEAIFKFQWEAVLNVEVTSLTLTAKDYIRLEQSETVRKTVVVK